MSDFLLKLANHPLGARLVQSLGLPKPVALAREPGGYSTTPLAGRKALLMTAVGGYAEVSIKAALIAAGADLAGVAGKEETSRFDIVVFDATACVDASSLRILYDGFHPVMRRLARNGRILVVANQPAALVDPVASASARGIEGFIRTLAKEVGKQGVCANLVYVPPAAVDQMVGLVGFFCGPRSTYVTGQSVHVGQPVTPTSATQTGPALTGKIALVTGSARGIGNAIAQRLSEEGAHVICLDVEAAREALYDTATKLGGTPLVMDIASPGASVELAEFVMSKFGGLDIVVHNAGVTRDRTLANMTEVQWDLVMAINFNAITEIDKALLARGAIRSAGRLVCLSSISGVAGNFGQSNYATTKAALIGYVTALAPIVAKQGITVNAVAPGFIETPMTQKIPFMQREMGRRTNSLAQGGQPRDVAELICFLASPGAAGITGNTIRVCGQALIGA